jgi:NADPH:quinone reductase-like Zn-dependent oxidoreductase
MSTIKAARIHAYGGPEVIHVEDSPRPTPGPGEVLVRVHSTTVNPFDCALRAGYLAGYFQPTFPLVLGTDLAGTIEELGPDTNSFERGDLVFGRGGVSRDGTNAEFAVLPATDVAPIPASLDFAHAAALPHVALTSWQALFELGGLAPGQTVLIHGAAGGVGHVATQLAKWRGARVIGTASKNIEFLSELPVDQVINYVTTPFESVAHDVDIVLDIIGGDTQERSWQTLKKGGILVSTVQPPPQEKADAFGVRQAMVYTNPPIGKTLTELGTLVENGTVRPHVSGVHPLAEIARVHNMIEGKHTRGKLVLQVEA